MKKAKEVLWQKKKKRIRARLPSEAQDTLRHKGGSHGTQKGDLGYNRAAEKRKINNLIFLIKPTEKSWLLL
jgi:hypothetical protein